jgi:hypothetical protein
MPLEDGASSNALSVRIQEFTLVECVGRRNGAGFSQRLTFPKRSTHSNRAAAPGACNIRRSRALQLRLARAASESLLTPNSFPCASHGVVREPLSGIRSAPSSSFGARASRRRKEPVSPFPWCTERGGDHYFRLLPEGAPLRGKGRARFARAKVSNSHLPPTPT